MNSSLDVQVFSVETDIGVALSLFEGSFVLQEVSSALLEAQSDLGQVDLLGNGLGGGDGNCVLLNEAWRIKRGFRMILLSLGYEPEWDCRLRPVGL